MKIRKLLAATVLVALPVVTLLDLPSGGAPAIAQSSTGRLFLELEGIDGSSTYKGHEKDIELQSYSMHVSNSAQATGATGTGAGKSKLESFTVTKSLDGSSPVLFDRVTKGKHIATATLFVRSGGTPDSVIVKYALTDVVLSSYEVSSNGGLPVEAVRLSFASVTTEVIPPSTVGKGTVAAKVTSTHSFATGK